MSSSSNYLEDSEVFLDAVPLNLSGITADLDAFDFMLQDEDGEEAIFADAQGSSSDMMDFRPSEIFVDMQCDTIHEDVANNFLPSYRPRASRRGQRDRSPSPEGKEKRRSRGGSNKVGEVESFDPPSWVHVGGSGSQHRREASVGDLSMCSVATAAQHHHHDGCCSSTKSTSSTTTKREYSGSEYNEALQNLAESMKRSEESRRVVVMMKRDLLTPDQQAALSEARERLQKQNAQVQSSFMAALNESRKQLGMYLGQVNQTF